MLSRGRDIPRLSPINPLRSRHSLPCLHCVGPGIVPRDDKQRSLKWQRGGARFNWGETFTVSPNRHAPTQPPSTRTIARGPEAHITQVGNGVMMSRSNPFSTLWILELPILGIGKQNYILVFWSQYRKRWSSNNYSVLPQTVIFDKH